MNNSRQNLSLAEKINKSFEEKIEEVVKINDYDRNYILNNFIEEERKENIRKKFKRAMMKANKQWKENLEKYKEVKESSLIKKQKELAKKLKLKSGMNLKKQEEIKKEKEEIKRIMKEEAQEAFQKSREKILDHLDKVEQQRQAYQIKLEEKSKILDRRHIRNLKKIRTSMHDRLEMSFDRHNKCKSQLDIEEQENTKRREEKKFQQFHDFYFFFQKQKRIKRQASLKRIEKMENNQKQRNINLSEMKIKNVNTIRKIKQAVENKQRADERLKEYLHLKKVEHERRTSSVFNYKKQLDEDRFEENKDTLSKQMDFISQNIRIDEANQLNSQHLKEQKILYHMGINVNQLNFKQRLNKELDKSLYKIDEKQRKNYYLKLKHEEQERRKKEEEERLKKLQKD